MTRNSIFILTIFSLFLSCSSNEPTPIASPPTISSINPSSGQANTQLTIVGTNFGKELASVQVTINGVVAELNEISETMLKVTVAAKSRTGVVKVTTPAGNADGPIFIYAYTTLVSTFSGTGVTGSNNGDASVATFNFPAGIARSSAGDIYVGDRLNHLVRKVTTAGVVTTYTGSTFGGTNGDVSVATFNGPNAIAFDAFGNMFVTEFSGHRIRMITPTGQVSTLAGSGSSGLVNQTGTLAQFASPTGLAMTPGGNMAVAEFGNHVIRWVTPAGVVTTLAGDGTPGYQDGTGSAAKFTSPTGVTMHPDGTFYVADFANYRIRKVTEAGVVTTYAGDGTSDWKDGQRLSAQFYAPRHLAFDADMNLIVVDAHLIRLIEPSGYVTTLAGNGFPGFVNGAGQLARLDNPYCVVVTGPGEIIIGERTHGVLRKLVYF